MSEEEGTKLILPSMEQKALIDALLGKRREPKIIVLHEQAHKLSVDERRARREKNKAKRRKGTAERTASLTARQGSLQRAKRIQKVAKAVERKHPHLHARGIAKNMLQIETELIGHIEKHIVGQRSIEAINTVGPRSTEVVNISGKLSIPEG